MKAILGRAEDVVITPEGRVVSGLLVVHSYVPGAEFVQFIQEEPDRLVARVCRGPAYNAESETAMRSMVSRLAGPTMCLRIEQVEFEDRERTPGGKVQEVISTLPREDA